MKLPSLTSVVVFAVIGAGGYGSYKLYSKVALEGRKAMNDATEHLEGYDSKGKKMRKGFYTELDKVSAKEKANKEAAEARAMFKKKLSTKGNKK